ncbi:putative PPE family protein PPE42 [Mycobacterium simulans]|nr:PPE family protein [Mycobacterium simulans]SON61748.1 putative PPE family protein PPE42 [Mycobacterium simulans]
MNFQLLPPEITSMRMFSGLGPEPLLAAAGGWSDLASELNSAAVSFESVTSGLVTEAWQGAAASAMTAAAAPYRAWLSAASTHADTAANLARAAATAFEAAQAATVFPAAISANRNRLVSLMMSNLFGFNAPAIAAAEAEYELMWAQDIAAMLGYHGEASAIAAALTPIVQPLANIANAPAQAVGALASAVAPRPPGPQPAVAVSLPELTIPPIQIPNFQLPSVNLLNLNFSDLTLPGIKIPQISVSGFSLPPVSLNMSASSLTIPSFTFPGFTSPGITLGGFSTPQLATAPLVLPSVAIPAGGFWIPSGGANIPANIGQLTSHLPSLNYMSVVIHGVPQILFDTKIWPVNVIDLELPSTIYINFALQVLGPTATPGIYIGDFNLSTGQFTGNTGFVLPPIQVSGLSIPEISIPAFQTPEITLTNPGLTIDIGSIGISESTLGPIIVPPISIGQFQIPQISVPGIEIGAFTTPGPIVGTGSLDIGLFDLIPRIGIDWTNPFEGIINPPPSGPYLGPLETPEISVAIDVPQINIPPIAIPPMSLGAVSIPPISLSPFNLGQISIPNIQVNGVTIGEISVPNVTITPTLPSISVGPFTVPSVSVSNFSLPTISFPKLTTPAISIYNPTNPVNTFGIDIRTYAFIDLSGSRLAFVPTPFTTLIHFGVPATQIPPLQIVNPVNASNPVSFVIDGAVNAMTLGQITVDGFNLALNGPAIQLADILVSPINLDAFNTPPVTVPPIAVGPGTGFNLPQIGLSGIQLGGFTTPGIAIPPINVAQTILPSFTLIPAIPL